MKHVSIIALAAITSLAAAPADAQRVRRGAYENAAGGVTAGGAHNATAPWGGRSVGRGGVVTDGDGNGVAGNRGCTRTAAGGRGCGAGATTWDEDGNVRHADSGYAQGPLGNTASTQRTFERDEDGDFAGHRETEVNVGDRTYWIDTTRDSDDGFDRDVQCSGSGCRD